MLGPLAQALARVTSQVAINFGTFRGWVRHLLALAEHVLGRLEPHVSVAKPQRVQRLVFVCLGNINRSAFAEAVAREHGLRAISIGLSTTTGAPAFEVAIAVAHEIGIDLSAHRATNLSDYARQEGDLLLAMEVRHVRRLLAAGVARSDVVLLGAWARPRRLHLHDPHTLGVEYFRTCFTLIRAAVCNLALELRGRESPCAVR